MSLFKTKCPRCNGTDINTVKGSGMGRDAMGCLALMFFWPALFFMKKSKPLNVCRACGFSWEKR